MGWRLWWMLAAAVVWALPARADNQDGGEDSLPDEQRRPPVAQRSFTDDPVHVMATVGFGTLVGFTGLTVGYNLHDRLELGAGAGVNGSGLMGGPYVRFRPFTRTRQKSRTLHAVAIDAGLSAGGFSYEDSVPGGLLGEPDAAAHPIYRSDLALFLQLEASWEMVTVKGFSLRAGGGGTVLLNPDNVQCEPAVSEDGAVSPCGEPPTYFPVLLFQFGTVF